MAKRIKTIAVITPGGDAPGMNTAIRAVVRTAIYHGLKVYGIGRGWYGLMHGMLHEMDIKSVGGIINRGGTILHTKRCLEFKKASNQKMAMEQLYKRGIQGLVVIGGDGSLKASSELIKRFKLPLIVIPASIDNDIPCTDYSIGYDTAVNTAIEAIDKIRDTAASHERLFVVEVMGRNNGFIALDVGLVCGAEAIIIPEVKYNLNKICKRLKEGQKRGKSSFIIVIAEGAAHASEIAEKIKKKVDLPIRISVLGHMQRGGSPTSLSRELACKAGAKAAELLKAGKHSLMIGMICDEVMPVSISKVLKRKKKINLEQYRLAEMLSI